MLSFKSLKATSGSIIQNSAKWRDNIEFSALKCGPKRVNFRERHCA